MSTGEWIAIGVIALVVGGAIGYIVKSKKTGTHCIGCPNGGKCGGCDGCNGCSGISASGTKQEDDESVEEE